MIVPTYQNPNYDLKNIIDLLNLWIVKQIDIDAYIWLHRKREEMGEFTNSRVFFTAFSSVPRYTGKKDLELTPEDLKAAQTIGSGWFPGNWSVDQAARTLLLLSLPWDNAEQYLRSLDLLFNAADVGELVTLYQALPLLPYPEKHIFRATEGIRSNITAVFNAVALHNPYPAEYFDNIAWNQMVLKALFVGSPLHQIQGLDRRANPELASMLIDYAHERWAAFRSVSPELWRPVGQFCTPSMVKDLERVFANPSLAEKQAAALACAESSLPEAKALLLSYPDLQRSIKAGDLTWKSLVNQLV